MHQMATGAIRNEEAMNMTEGPGSVYETGVNIRRCNVNYCRPGTCQTEATLGEVIPRTFGAASGQNIEKSNIMVAMGGYARHVRRRVRPKGQCRENAYKNLPPERIHVDMRRRGCESSISNK